MDGGEVITFTKSSDLVFGFYVYNPNAFNNSDAYYNFLPNNYSSTGSGAQWLSQGI